MDRMRVDGSGRLQASFRSFAVGAGSNRALAAMAGPSGYAPDTIDVSRLKNGGAVRCLPAVRKGRSPANDYPSRLPTLLPGQSSSRNGTGRECAACFARLSAECGKGCKLVKKACKLLRAENRLRPEAVRGPRNAGSMPAD